MQREKSVNLTRQSSTATPSKVAVATPEAEYLEERPLEEPEVIPPK